MSNIEFVEFVYILKFVEKNRFYWFIMPVWIRTMINHELKKVQVDDINNINEYIRNG